MLRHYVKSGEAGFAAIDPAVLKSFTDSSTEIARVCVLKVSCWKLLNRSVLGCIEMTFQSQ